MVQVDTYEGVLFFVRDETTEELHAVFSERQHERALERAKSLGCACVEEEGAFIRLRESDGDRTTPWLGPFDSMGDAYEHVREQYSVDPETGAELGKPLEDEYEDLDGLSVYNLDDI